ncbi:MAG: MBL fold metallo-hydrolase [Proteobacteria bacterium]|nr:MAG: MBL fold metallo-hydrolase [Pseudomonadota bacterium]
MEVTFHGAVGTVTGSRFMVSTATTKVLIDCGLFQGVKVLRRRNRRPPTFDAAELDAVVLTHAHVDHSGYLPALLERGFDAPVYATAPTCDLCQILLRDAGRLQEEEARYANRKGYSRHSPARPLYTEQDAIAVLDRFEARPWLEPFTVGDLCFEYLPAGHILGAASVRVSDEAGHSVLFSGDLGRDDDLIMYPPVEPPRADVVVMESTYGDRLHRDQDPIVQLGAVAKRTLERGGVLLIPAFAVGRAQAMLLALDEVFARGLAPRAPIYLNSPMANAVSALYHTYTQEHRLTKREIDRLFGKVRFIRSESESRDLNRQRGPMVIVSASGMLSGGRVLHHLRAFGPEASTTIVIAGYQAAGTRGRKLLEGAQYIKIHGHSVRINAEVVPINLFSAHGDRDDLTRWLRGLPQPPREVVLVHGEPAAADALRSHLQSELGWHVHAADAGERVQL